MSTSIFNMSKSSSSRSSEAESTDSSLKMLKRYGSTLFRRVIRLILPTLVVALLQQQLCIQGLTDISEVAESKVLQSGILGRPLWCQVRTVPDFIQFAFAIFLNPDRKVILDRGSAIWCMYDFFWGSFYSYCVSVTTMHMTKGWRRWMVYLLLALGTWFASSSNFIFTLGVVLGDLAATGAFKRFQSKNVLVISTQLVLVAFALLLIIRQDFFKGLNDWVPSVTLNPRTYEIGYSLTWPEVSKSTYWLTTYSILLWVELSPTAQYFLGSWPLTFFGKISFPFFLLQMIVIYTVMPRVVLSLSDNGVSFWSVITLSFIVSCIVLTVISYLFLKVIEEPITNLSVWLWKYVTYDTHFSAKSTFSTFTAFISRNLHRWNLVRILKKFWRTAIAIYNWRNITIRKDDTYPQIPTKFEQPLLSSTEWTTNISADPKARRTRWLLNLNSYLWIVHLIGIPALTLAWLFLNPFKYSVSEILTISSMWRILWCLSLPYCFISYMGFSYPRIAWSETWLQKNKKVERPSIRNFYIVNVTRGSNEEAVRRSYKALKPLENLHTSIRVIVLTDEPYAYPDLQNVVCPQNHIGPNGVARHKARALDYFRTSMKVDKYDWILHMDEESTIDAESLRRCFDFVRYETHHIGQGLILYNAHGYWKNWFFAVADAIRVGDDLARFNLQYTFFQRPVFGIHGSFLLINGQVEQEVTWDFGSLAEDFEFSQAAWAKGFTCGAVHGIVREQSPVAVLDFLKQRKRWYIGIRQIQGVYSLPAIAVKLWTVGVFCLAATVINIPFSFYVDTALSPVWIVAISSFCFANFYWLYLWGLLFQELDYGTKWYMMILHMVAGVVIQPLASFLEGCAVIWGINTDHDYNNFEVIKK
jgi:hypothetical protein